MNHLKIFGKQVMNNTNADNIIVIDTHILIWYLEGIELNDTQIKIIEKARKH